MFCLVNDILEFQNLEFDNFYAKMEVFSPAEAIEFTLSIFEYNA